MARGNFAVLNRLQMRRGNVHDGIAIAEIACHGTHPHDIGLKLP
jgi:hypothetical protein